MSERWKRGICGIGELGETWREGLREDYEEIAQESSGGALEPLLGRCLPDSYGDDVDQTLGIPGPIGL